MRTRGWRGDRSGGSSVDDGRRRRWRLRWSIRASQGLERRGGRNGCSVGGFVLLVL
ncbi:hypothetical protein DEO72_LG4g1348 [Vigna unguiculata]|uniref:Uncharacterized protein n=1 Tax=Vigna unguiculata TaxID=3917 RepID=A0A4D6LPJ1_VIGUN|nr:hypothetical protein DEO72_LG4g1348 [Vigna unguiculata]